MAHPEVFRLADDIEAAHRAAAALFARVAGEIGPLLPPSAEIVHIGATAIPGCLTKGDLDIVVRIDAAEFAAAEAVLANRLARNTGSAHTAAFAAFEDAHRSPHLGIQLAARGGPFDHFHRFAAVLRADPVFVRQYNRLKRAHENRPMSVYRAAKDTFVENVLRPYGTDGAG